jgi:lipopolysaccharide export system protein LptC
MKRSATSEQVLNMNHTDFERAAGGMKIKFTFQNLHLTNGRINYQAKHSVVAKDLTLLLQENDQTKLLIKDKVFEFSMNTGFQLKIKNTTPVTQVEPEPVS